MTQIAASLFLLLLMLWCFWELGWGGGPQSGRDPSIIGRAVPWVLPIKPSIKHIRAKYPKVVLFFWPPRD